MQVLVVGFSVVAEASFVEVCRSRTEERADVRFEKAGIGGWFPYLLRHVIGEILEQYDPDHVVFEIATSSLRNQDRAREDHLDSLRTLAAVAVQHGIRRVSFLDLPRADVDERTDWMWPMHQSFCERYGLGYKNVPFRNGILRDVVHASAEGREVFADSLMSILESSTDIPERNRLALLELDSSYSSIPASRYAVGAETRDYSRGGYHVSAVKIPAGESVNFDFDTDDQSILGFSMLMGPTSGVLSLTEGNFSHRSGGYDQFCYYERVGAPFFGERRCSSLSIRQEPEVPETPLLKGEKNYGPRTGYIASFFVANQTQTANAAPAQHTRVLVVGFSVTGELSFVEEARRRTVTRKDVTIEKVGLGAWTPYMLRHVIGDILDEYKPNAVIYEVATSQLRAQGRSRVDHQASLDALASAAACRGIRRVSFLDLPRSDVTEEGDWLCAMHQDFCAKHGFGYAHVPFRSDLLRDLAHPTDEGKRVYADAFMPLLETGVMPDATQAAFSRQQNPYRSIPAHLCVSPNTAARRAFQRSGYRETCVSIPAGEKATFDFGDTPVRLVGFSMLLGPQTGRLTLEGEGFQHEAKGYDAFCYYERVGPVQVAPHLLTRLSIRQEAEIPDTPLAKGEKSLEARLGQIGRFFIEEDRKSVAKAAPTVLKHVKLQNRLIHLHQPRTGGRSLQAAFRARLPHAQVVTFNPREPDVVQAMLDRDDWQVFTGAFFTLPGRIAQSLLKQPIWMTVVRDPAARILSFLNYARTVPLVRPWHERLAGRSTQEGLRQLVEAGTTYGQSSQCRAIAWGEETPDFDGARRAIDRRYRMICALEHLDQAFGELAQMGLVPQDSPLPHVFRSEPPADPASLDYARELLKGTAAEDFALHDWLLQAGPIVTNSNLNSE